MTDKEWMELAELCRLQAEGYGAATMTQMQLDRLDILLSRVADINAARRAEASFGQVVTGERPVIVNAKESCPECP